MKLPNRYLHQKSARAFSSIATSIGTFSLLSTVFATTAFANAALYLEPANGTIECPQEFDVEVVIDTIGTNGGKTTGSRSVITYDPNILKVVSIDLPAQNPFYPRLPLKDFSNPGEIYVAGLANNGGPYPEGKGSYATIKFKAAAAGTSKLDFKWEQGSAEFSNIIKYVEDGDPVNILEEVHSASFTVVGDCEEATPAPTRGTVPPTELPKAGNDGLTLLLVLGSIGLTTTGFIGFKLYN